MVVTNMEGLPLSSDLDPDTTETIAAITTSLVGKALDAVRELTRGVSVLPDLGHNERSNQHSPRRERGADTSRPQETKLNGDTLP